MSEQNIALNNEIKKEKTLYYIKLVLFFFILFTCMCPAHISFLNKYSYLISRLILFPP